MTDKPGFSNAYFILSCTPYRQTLSNPANLKLLKIRICDALPIPQYTITGMEREMGLNNSSLHKQGAEVA